MIKLIATDMDGTLLNDSKKLPDNFEDVIGKLKDKKIHFVISSGRSFCTLKEQFASHLNELTFICDNGAYVVLDGKAISVSVLPKETVKEAVLFCEKLGLTVLLCGRNGTWHNAKNVAQNNEIKSYYVNEVRMDNLSECDDDIFKIAIFEENGIEKSGYPKIADRFGDDFNVQLSGNYWTDIMNKGITKGQALSKISNTLGVSYNETMAFGDYLNDVDMLNAAYYSYAMSNAHDSVKRVANFMTGSNNDNSVMNEVIRHCL